MAGNLGRHFEAVKAHWQSTDPALPTPIKVEPAPFVTIARQAGAGGRTLAVELAARLNEVDPGPPDWWAYDRDLVNMIATDHHLSELVVASLEETSHTLIRDIVESLVYPGKPSQRKIFNRAAQTVLGLAGRGRAVIVGLGGVFITRRLPRGLHLYLVAPLDARVERMANEWDCSVSQAAKKVREIDNNRRSFYQQYFPEEQVTPEAFTVTLNTGKMSEYQLVEALLPLVTSLRRPE